MFSNFSTRTSWTDHRKRPLLSVRRLVSPLFTFLACFSFFSSLRLPKCPIDRLYHCPCQPARDWCSRVSGLVFYCFCLFWFVLFVFLLMVLQRNINSLSSRIDVRLRKPARKVIKKPTWGQSKSLVMGIMLQPELRAVVISLCTQSFWSSSSTHLRSESWWQSRWKRQRTPLRVERAKTIFAWQVDLIDLADHIHKLISFDNDNSISFVRQWKLLFLHLTKTTGLTKSIGLAWQRVWQQLSYE